MRRKNWLGLLGILGLMLCLAGCDLDGGNVAYEVIYPSGYARDCYTGEKTAPVEGTEYTLSPADGDLQVLDGAGKVTAEYPGLLEDRRILRGEDAGEGKLWICSESWDTPHYSGYRGGYRRGGLMESDLFLADLDTGDILISRTLGKNELYLTMSGGKCYFYRQGEEAREAWFGLVHTPKKNAAVCAKSLENWDETEAVWEFDYAVWPEGAPEWEGEKRLRFYVGEDTLVIAPAAEAGEPDRVEIPLIP